MKLPGVSFEMPRLAEKKNIFAFFRSTVLIINSDFSTHSHQQGLNFTGSKIHLNTLNSSWQLQTENHPRYHLKASSGWMRRGFCSRSQSWQKTIVSLSYRMTDQSIHNALIDEPRFSRGGLRPAWLTNSQNSEGTPQNPDTRNLLSFTGMFIW